MRRYQRTGEFGFRVRSTGARKQRVTEAGGAMLSAEAFDCLHTHVSAVEARDSGPWTVAQTPVTLTTRSRLKMPVLRAFFRSGGDIDVVVTFRVERGLFRRRILAWLEIDGREAARGISKLLELKHTFDRTVL